MKRRIEKMAWNKLRNKRGVSLLTALTFSLSLFGGVSVAGINVKAKTSNINNPRIEDDGTVTWDKVEFGNYYQDVSFDKEPIKWRILSVNEDGSDAFLLADKALDCKPYNEIRKDVTWKESSLRKWLNDTEDEESFLNTAFTKDEQKIIRDTIVKNEANPQYGTLGGEDTTDKVYLMSTGEVSNTLYGFASTLDSENIARNTKASDYAKVMGAYCRKNIGEERTCYWWLRSPGSMKSNAVYSTLDCWVQCNGGYVDDNTIAVRPVIHIDLTQSGVSDAGKVSSDGTLFDITDSGYVDDGYVDPIISGGITTWDCVYFGKYKQNAKYEKKPIEWRVLAVDGDDAFLLSDKALDCKPYNQNREEVTWENCTLRKWLNDITSDKSFINMAFSTEERNAIKNTKVINRINIADIIEGGADTTDKIYLLSVSESINCLYGFDASFEWGKRYKTREISVSDYASLNGAHLSSDYSTVYWWLRSPGDSKSCASYISSAGEGGSGRNVDYLEYTVRPALHINLNSANLQKVGTVSSESTITTEKIDEQKQVNYVSKLIANIGEVTKDSSGKISSARNAYNNLKENLKEYVSNYSVLQEAEEQLKKLENPTNGADNININSDNNTGSKSNVASSSDNNNVGNNSNPTAEKDSNLTETRKDNTTTFNINNKKTYKKSKKIVIKDDDGIKSVVLNTKKIKVKKGKKSVLFKLSSYKKILKKKNKWNKIIVTDVNDNKKIISFKVK